MRPAATEHVAEYHDLDIRPTSAVLAAIAGTQRQAVAAVEAAIPSIAIAADVLAARVRAGGRLVYAGAGSSGFLAHGDASELPGTFGLDPGQVRTLVAGRREGVLTLDQADEDDAEQAQADVDALAIESRDTLVGISASGRTPYTVAALDRAGTRGALTIGIACDRDAPLLLAADHPILLDTPPEVIAGSTRLAAGTAQKIALNMLSTVLGLRLGHGYQGLMVNLQADNLKLRRRAVAIVAQAAGVPEEQAAAALAQGRRRQGFGSVKPAILICQGASPDEAQALLTSSQGDVRQALKIWSRRTGSRAGWSDAPLPADLEAR